MIVASNGIQLHVQERGSGELALLFLHYWGGSSRSWSKVIDALPELYRSIALDQRGWGKSDAPSGSYALADLAGDAEGVIAALGLRRYILVGHSMGGKVVQLMASRHPQGLAGLVLVAPSPPSPMALPPEAREAMIEAYATRSGVATVIDHVLTGHVLSPADREQVIEDSLRGAPPAKAAWPRAMSQEDITHAATEIAVPTIVIAGERDQVDRVEVLKAELLPRIPHATLHVLPGTGHLSPLEAPEAIARLIVDFAGSLGRAE